MAYTIRTNPIKKQHRKLVQKSRTFFRQILWFYGMQVDSVGTKQDSNGIIVDRYGF